MVRLAWQARQRVDSAAAADGALMRAALAVAFQCGGVVWIAPVSFCNALGMR
jgi:hypothetical protein